MRLDPHLDGIYRLESRLDTELMEEHPEAHSVARKSKQPYRFDVPPPLCLISSDSRHPNAGHSHVTLSATSAGADSSRFLLTFGGGRGSSPLRAPEPSSLRAKSTE